MAAVTTSVPLVVLTVIRPPVAVLPLMLVMLVLPTSLASRLPVAMRLPPPVPPGSAVSLTFAMSSAALIVFSVTVAVLARHRRRSACR
ncbi:hypothetical protein HK414_03050 [Ramlibacter terrae]|uniref:Uncharacterized protein n=1 Tax=Ramlibacter terrae TaxID=2732511 RepID=A0ABX6P0B9_9BURK|nr:hypothetical protein HK414_03050 [Ramlibacter terrae]